MITKTEARKIKEVIGYPYSFRIQEYLTHNNVVKADGNPYSIRHIINIVNGESSNLRIEEYIFQLFQIRLKQQSDLKEKKQKIFQKVK